MSQQALKAAETPGPGQGRAAASPPAIRTLTWGDSARKLAALGVPGWATEWPDPSHHSCGAFLGCEPERWGGGARAASPPAAACLPARRDPKKRGRSPRYPLAIPGMRTVLRGGSLGARTWHREVTSALRGEGSTHEHPGLASFGLTPKKARSSGAPPPLPSPEQHSRVFLALTASWGSPLLG